MTGSIMNRVGAWIGITVLSLVCAPGVGEAVANLGLSPGWSLIVEILSIPWLWWAWQGIMHDAYGERQ